MAYCNAYLERQTLFRGQTRDYGSVVSSSWRDQWSDRRFHAPLQALVDAFFVELLNNEEFEAGLAAVTATAGARPTFYRYLAEPASAALLIQLLTHSRETLGWWLCLEVAHVQLEQLEESFNTRFHSYLFNETNDAFFKRFIPNTLRALVELTLSFYDEDRAAFDVEYRIKQVVIDIVGVLQHYGVIGTPGLDLTDEVDVALWFATHEYEKEKRCYRRLHPHEWGDSVVYEFDAPVVTFSPTPQPGQLITALPRERLVNLSTLSRRFSRIVTQHGWYAIDLDGWTRLVDFAAVFPMRRKTPLDYGDSTAIQKRTATLTQQMLFPSAEDDPFKAYLARHGIETLL